MKVLLPLLGTLLVAAITATISLYGSVRSLTVEVTGLRRDVTRLEQRIDVLAPVRFSFAEPRSSQ